MTDEEKKAKKKAYNKLYKETHKAEAAARHKAYYESHKAEYAAQRKAYRETHKAERAAYQKVYNESHKAELSASKRVYREANYAKCMAYEKAYREAHKTENAVSNKAYREAHKEMLAAYRSKHKFRKYRMTHAEYDAMLAAQDGCCAICGSAPNMKRLHVDHDHATGKVRGLLCNSCNLTLGAIKDDVHTLFAMIGYLKGWTGIPATHET